MNKNTILNNLLNPAELERLYRRAPREFESAFEQSIKEMPESETLQVWHARLNYRSVRTVLLLPVLVSALFAGLFVQLPHVIPGIESWFWDRLPQLAVFAPVIAYFCGFSLADKRARGLAIALVAWLVYMVMLPEGYGSDSVTMALVHSPLVLISLTGVSFTGAQWRCPDARLNYIRYLGEVCILSVLILLGGVILTGLTIGLFELLGWGIADWYLDHIVPAGLVCAPVIATYLYDQVLQRQSRFASVLSNVFSPLFLLTVTVYLLAMIIEGEDPYSDRDFLILLNGLVLVVWAITVFAVAGKRESKTKMDWLNVALIVVTLILNALALSAILFRWYEYGMTYNRIIVTGANALMFVHLSLILRSYAGYLGGRSDYRNLSAAVAGFLPVYSGWSVIVAFILPLLFGFE